MYFRYFFGDFSKIKFFFEKLVIHLMDIINLKTKRYFLNCYLKMLPCPLFLGEWPHKEEFFESTLRGLLRISGGGLTNSASSLCKLLQSNGTRNENRLVGGGLWVRVLLVCIGWPQTHYVAQIGFKLWVILLPQPHKFCVSRSISRVNIFMLNKMTQFLLARLTVRKLFSPTSLWIFLNTDVQFCKGSPSQIILNSLGTRVCAQHWTKFRSPSGIILTGPLMLWF